tara:strand:- start:8080 stop:8622 length:543 start_codon:yes stop_codon:yes gene_type:complete
MKDMFSGRSGRIEEWDDDAESSDLDIQKMALHHFMTLSGIELDYYGADGGDNTFKVDGIVFKVLEDPSDGYRSMLGAIDYTEDHDSIFFRTPIAKVKIETYDTSSDADHPDHPDRHLDDDECQVRQGYKLVDVNDGHVWLEFGTDNMDDYYPYFIFRYTPKPPKTTLGDVCPELKESLSD